MFNTIQIYLAKQFRVLKSHLVDHCRPHFWVPLATIRKSVSVGLIQGCQDSHNRYIDQMQGNVHPLYIPFLSEMTEAQFDCLCVCFGCWVLCLFCCSLVSPDLPLSIVAIRCYIEFQFAHFTGIMSGHRLANSANAAEAEARASQLPGYTEADNIKTIEMSITKSPGPFTQQYNSKVMFLKLDYMTFVVSYCTSSL